MQTGLILLAIAVVAVCVVILGNRFWPDDTTIHTREPDRPLEAADAALQVTTWNIGYGALGKDADTFLDGGKSLRALAKPQITAAARAIAHRLSQTTSDVICVQEIAKAGFLTRQTDVLGMIDAALAKRTRYIWTDMKTVLVPRGLRIAHGMATYCARAARDSHVIALPHGRTLMLGFIQKHYAGVQTRLPIGDTGKSWVVINLHLPVYKTSQTARVALLDHLFQVAAQEYAQGNFVVIAGDWNMQLCLPDDVQAGRIIPFAQDRLPAGWHIQADRQTPTVRYLDAPFVQGQTETAIFDGFVVSPNVQTVDVTTQDLGFADTDHQPVTGKFVCRAPDAVSGTR